MAGGGKGDVCQQRGLRGTQAYAQARTEPLARLTTAKHTRSLVKQANLCVLETLAGASSTLVAGVPLYVCVGVC